VGSDTAVNNGKIYKQLYCDNTLSIYSRIHPRYQRLDSVGLQLLAYSSPGVGTEYMIDSLLLDGNSNYRFMGSRLDKSYTMTFLLYAKEKVFGQSLFSRWYNTGAPDFKWLKYKVVKELGITTIAFSDNSDDVMFRYNYSCYDTLVYASINGKEYGTALDVKVENKTKYQFELFQNYPNPFNPTTTIRFTLLKPQNVTLSVFDILGREVVELIHNQMITGNHSVYFNANELSSGFYIYRLSTDNYSNTKLMLLLK